MFYTEYRPQKFSDLVGLSQSLKSLQTQIAGGEVPHAFFFYGPRGTGKTSTARIVAKALNCLDLGQNGEPCGKCQNCKSIQTGRFLDLIEIDAASNRGIDDIRDLREKIKLAPSGGKYKVYIIDEVHMLTVEAFNALLKTLEEPPKHAVFILATTDPHKVPVTIKSRCQTVEFKRADMTSLVTKLGQIAKDQKAKITEEDLKLIAKAGNGGFRDAETLLEEVIKGGVTTQEVIGLLADSRISEFVDYLVVKDSKNALLLVNSVFEGGVDLALWVRELLEYLRKVMLVKAGVGPELVEASEEEFERMGKIGGMGDIGGIQNIIQVFMRAYENLKLAAVPQLPLEVAVLEIISSVGAGLVPARQQEPEGHALRATTRVAPTTKGAESLKVSDINSKWDEVLVNIKPYNHSLEAVLRSCFPAEVTDGMLTLGVPFKFHLEKLNDAKNYQIVKKVLTEVLGQEIDYTCKVQKKEVTPLDKLKDAEKRAKKVFTGEITI